MLAWDIRLGLWLFPLLVLRQLLVRRASCSNTSPREQRLCVHRVGWAVELACRYVPAATCLTQALVTRTLLARCGCHAIVRIGVARSETGELQAHAWVEVDGSIVIGGSESQKHYTPLATF